MKTISIKSIIKSIPIILFLLSQNLSNCQISYNSDNDIILPNLDELEGIGASAPLDIIYANNSDETPGKIYIYTLKRILVYNYQMSEFYGAIELFGGEYGKFAPQYHNPHLYEPDVKLMAHDANNKVLYFVSPELTVRSVSTDGINLNTYHEINTPSNVNYASLHAFSKLEYDNNHNRLYWFFRSKFQNLHSYDSFIGVYKKNSGSWNSIFEEYKIGHGDFNYLEVVSTFTYNPENNDFYICRKNRIENWRIDIDESSASKEHYIITKQIRNGKMIVLGHPKSMLLVFPYRVGYDLMEEDHLIYQINTNTFIADSSITAPSKMILDAIYLPEPYDDILMCYANDTAEKQINTGENHDIAYLQYVENTFQQIQTIYTQGINEIDTNTLLNLNRPFKLLFNSADSSILVSKKNEIVELQPNDNYSLGSLYYARDNFFGKGVEVGGNSFILNSLTGIERFYENFHSTNRTTFPAYNTEYNPLNRKMYIFNRLSTEQSGFYVYNLDQENMDFVETQKPIGDLVYNKYKNHILISEFNKDEGSGAIIRVFNAETMEELDTLKYIGLNYPGRMFVAPNGKIYISMNMKTDNNYPSITIIDANDYLAPTENVSAEYFEIPEYSYTLQSFYCYNPYNKKVYATIGPYFSVNPPYQTSYNSPLESGFGDPTDDPTNYPGVLISIDDQDSVVSFPKDNPSEVICATPNLISDDPNYQGTLFINGRIALNTFNCNTNEFQQFNGVSYLFDIEYSPLSNCLYACKNINIEDSLYAPDKNMIHIYKIHEDGTILENFWEKQGFASSISYNQYDDQLYVYYIGDDNLLGQQQAKVFTLNPYADQQAETDSVTLSSRTMGLEIVPQANHPHFDAYNKAYFPNGAHSSVSVVEYTAKEALKLHFTGDKLLEWVSIPRMVGNETTNWDDQQNTSLVFDRYRFGTPYSNLELLYLNLQTSYDPEYKVTWDEDLLWKYTPPEPTDNKNIFSYRGYTLKLDDTSDNYIYMYGNIKDPATSFPLYPGQFNSMGYFLTQEQDIFDALGAETLGLIDLIDHQDYCCEKKGGANPDGPTHGEIGPIDDHYWICDKHQTNIKYGEMVKLHSSETEQVSIQWQNSGNTTREKLRPDVEYFTYSETSSYTVITIVLNYESNPLEIGAFVNEQCIGAVALMPEDSVVILRAYLDGISPDSIVFQDWFGTKSSENGIIKDYRVFNKSTGFYENRVLKSNIISSRVRISFKEGDGEEDFDIVENSIDIWPNPARDKLNYSFYSDVGGKLNISLFDINGKLVSMLIDKVYQKGSVSGVVGLKGYSGYSVKPGIYFVKIKMGDSIITKKLVVQ